MQQVLQIFWTYIYKGPAVFGLHWIHLYFTGNREEMLILFLFLQQMCLDVIMQTC